MKQMKLNVLIAATVLAVALLSCDITASSQSNYVMPGMSVKVLILEEDGWSNLTVQAREPGIHLIRTVGKIDAVLRVFDRFGQCLGSSDDVFDLDAAVAISMSAGETVAVEVSMSPGAKDRPAKATTAVSITRLDLPVTRLAAGASARGSIGLGRPARFVFTAPANGLVLVETEIEGDLDTLLAIRDDGGMLLESNDDRSKDDLSSVLVVAVERGRQYECLVGGVGQDDSGFFDLKLSAVEAVGADDYPDRAIDPTGTVMDASSKRCEIVGAWEQWNDADVVDLVFADAGLYRLEIHSDLDSIMTVYDRMGRPIRADDDSGKNSNARLVVEAGQGERLRALLRPLSNIDHGEWRLSVRRVGDGLPAPIQRDIGAFRIFGLAACVADFPSPKSLCDAVTDAWNFRRFLTRSLGARDEDVRVLLDDIGVREDDLTVPHLRAALGELATKAGPEDVVIFAYSGHGNSSAGRSSLEPEIRSYEENLLRRDLDRIRAGRVIVLIDACNSGSFVSSLAAPNRWVYVSSRVDESSNASLAGQPERTGGSLFFSYLFDELMYRAETRSFAVAFRRAAVAVTRLDGEQHPVAHEPAEFRLLSGALRPQP